MPRRRELHALDGDHRGDARRGGAVLALNEEVEGVVRKVHRLVGDDVNGFIEYGLHEGHGSLLSLRTQGAGYADRQQTG